MNTYSVPRGRKDVSEDTPGLKPLIAGTGKEVKLAMQEIVLAGKILAVGAKLVVRHVFASAEKNPVEIIYSFVLPRDGALRRFKIVGDGFSVHSELFPTKEAEEKYEKAIASGHLTTLARQYRDGNINLSVGNVRPGETVTVFLEIIGGVDLTNDGLRFRFPFTLAPCYHAGMRVGRVDGVTGEIELPDDEFGGVILPPFRADTANLHRVAFDLSLRMPQEIRSVSSPSHCISVSGAGSASARVALSPEKDVPNRDLVLDVRLKNQFSGVLQGADRDGKGRFAAVVASGEFGEAPDGPRNVVFVLDRSGSMSGEPMEQARRAVLACVGALGPEDRVGMVAFDNHTEFFERSMLRADDQTREKLRGFVAGIEARGGTEMLAGLEAARLILSEAGGDVFLITDGQVFGTEDIVRGIKDANVRVHCLGIGSSSQDRFLNLLTRETGGIGRFITTRERVDKAALELFAAACQPLASSVTDRLENIENGVISPAPAAMVFKGRPLVVFGEGNPGQGNLIVEWEAGGEKRTSSFPLDFKGRETEAEILGLIRGSRLITDLEVELGGAEGMETGPGKKERKRRERALEELGREYGLANLMMSLVAVVERAGDRAGAIPKTMVVPVGIPEGVEFDAYFNVQASMCFDSAIVENCCVCSPRKISSQNVPEQYPKYLLGKDSDDSLAEIVLAGKLKADGGMPGADVRDRIALSLAALLVVSRGAEMLTITERLLKFIEQVDTSCLSKPQRQLVKQVLDAVRAGDSIGDIWESMGEELAAGSLEPDEVWKALEKEFNNS